MTCRFLSLTSEALWPELLQMLADRGNPDQSVEADVRAMLDAVRKDGDAAVLGYVRRFDCPAMQPPCAFPRKRRNRPPKACLPKASTASGRPRTTSGPSMRRKRTARGSSPATTGQSSARKSAPWTGPGSTFLAGAGATRRSSPACS